MRPRQLTELLAKAIDAGLPILITGEPGIGKSDLVKQAADAAGADLIISHPVVADPTDAKGFPWPDAENGCANFLPFGELAEAIAAKRKTVWFLDDLGQAAPAVQASFMQLLLARRVNGHKLPDCVTFVAATNRRTDRAGVAGILEPVKSRFAAIVELDAEIDDWSAWAVDNDLPAELIAFLRFRPDLLSQFKPSADLTNCPVPRTWANAAKVIGLGLDGAIETMAISGAVGQAAATEFLAFRRMFRELPSIDAILIDPTTAKVPSSPGALYAVATGLAARAKADNFERVAKYAERLVDAGRGEFAALLVRDAIRRDEEIPNTAAFIKMASGPVGELISG